MVPLHELNEALVDADRNDIARKDTPYSLAHICCSEGVLPEVVRFEKLLLRVFVDPVEMRLSELLSELVVALSTHV